jgi:hypothetical protein
MHRKIQCTGDFSVKARFYGGPLDGQEAHVPDNSTVVVMPKTKTTPPVRYRLTKIDASGIAQFFVVRIGFPAAM